MSEPATSTPEAEMPAPTRNNNNNTTRNNNNNRRRPNNRNSNLASMAYAERNFKGKIEDLPVIGKPYEQTDPYEKLIDAGDQVDQIGGTHQCVGVGAGGGLRGCVLVRVWQLLE